jgi:hypothetical protein
MNSKGIFVVKQPAAKCPRVPGVHCLSDASSIHRTLSRSRKEAQWRGATWLAFDSGSANTLLEEVQGRKNGTYGRLALLEKITPSRLAIANKYFTITVSEPGLHWLPPEQVMRILGGDAPEDRVVAGMVDQAAGNLLLYRGDLQPVVAPLESFNARGSVKPNFDDFEITDWGHTVRLGEFEAATDAILYENDSEFRRRKKQERRAGERTFGASLRRLRLQRELRQSDFEPEVTAKTIARIENGEVERSHGRTLRHIAHTLRVEPDEIESY